MQPGSVKKVQESKMAFKCMENINSFLEAARNMGVPSQELFQTVDLWEKQNLNSVVICLQALGRKVFISKNFKFLNRKSIRLFLLKRHPSTDKPLSARRKPIRTLASSLRNSWGPVTLSSPCSTAPTRVLTRAALTLATLGTCRLLNQKKKTSSTFSKIFFFFFLPGLHHSAKSHTHKLCIPATTIFIIIIIIYGEVFFLCVLFDTNNDMGKNYRAFSFLKFFFLVLSLLVTLYSENGCRYLDHIFHPHMLL